MVNVVLSFDDGREDNYRVVKEILDPLQIPATFNITTGYVENLDTEMKMPCGNKPLSKKQCEEIAANPLFEIAGHGNEHENAKENLIFGVKKLREWCGMESKAMGIASPHSLLSENKIISDYDVYKSNNIAYIRIGDRVKSFSIIKKCLRKLNGFFHIPYIFYFIYKETFLSEHNAYIYYSIPVLKQNTVREVLYFVKKAIKKDKSFILMFHSILKPSEDYYDELWSWDYNKFLELCQKLKEYEKNNKISLCKTIELARI